MKCKSISTKAKAEDFNKVEQDINAWLQDNPNVKILFISQAPFATQTILTTIFYQ